MARPSMERLSPPVRRSLRRSRIRRDVLVALVEHGATYPQDLADKVRATPARLRDAIFGRAPHYKRRTSLVALRLVRVRRDRHGELVALTPRGARAGAILLERGLRA